MRLDPIAVSSASSRGSVQVSGSFCNFLFLLDLLVICTELLVYMDWILPQKEFLPSHIILSVVSHAIHTDIK